MIRHAGLEPPPPRALTVAVIEPALGALLVTAVGRAALASPRLGPADETAIALSTIAASAQPEQGPAVGIQTHPLPKNEILAVQRHPLCARGFDNDANSWQLQIDCLAAFPAKVAQLQEPRR